jgi:hypothetical protein
MDVREDPISERRGKPGIRYWIIALAASALVGLLTWPTFLVREQCYCGLVEPASFYPIRITAIPEGCAVLSFPAHWQTPEGKNIVDARLAVDDPKTSKLFREFSRIEIRRIRGTTTEFLVALRDEMKRDEPMYYTLQKYVFQFGHPSQGSVRPLRQATQQDWAEGVPITDSPPSIHLDISFEHDWGAAIVNGKRFPKAETNFFRGDGVLTSAEKHLIAVMSYSGPEYFGADLGVDTDVALLGRPKRNIAIEIYRMSDGLLQRRVDGWICRGTSAHLAAAWHDDEFFSIPLNESYTNVLLCQF